MCAVAVLFSSVSPTPISLCKYEGDFEVMVLNHAEEIIHCAEHKNLPLSM
jgi:hypothetical protein